MSADGGEKRNPCEMGLSRGLSLKFPSAAFAAWSFGVSEPRKTRIPWGEPRKTRIPWGVSPALP